MNRTFPLPLVAALALLCSGHAQPPGAAFDYVSVDTLLATNDVEEARQELARSRLGFSGAFDFDPTITYGGDVDEAAEFEFGFDANLGVDYRYDSVAILSDEMDLLGAEARLADRRRADIEAALLAHVDLLRAIIAVGIEQTDLDNEQADVDRIQDEMDAGEATAAELEDARIDLDGARLDLEQAQSRLVNTRSQAVRYGMGPDPVFAILRFELPDAAPEQTYDYRRLVLALRRADALGLQDSAFGVLEEIVLETSYGTDDTNVALNAHLNRGRPGAGLDLGYDYPATDTTAGWEIELRLSLRVDDRTPGDFSAAQRDLAEAQIALEQFLSRFSRDAIGERQDAEYAWQELQLARRQLENDRARLVEVRAILETLPGEVARLQQQADRLRADRDAATGDARTQLDQQVRDADAELRDAQSDLRSAQSDLAALERSLPRSEDALYREWGDYVRAVEDYLSVVDGDWVTAE